jgi:hypothetical protein
MAPLYLNRLSRSEYQALVRKLWDTQKGRCFICENPIDLALHGDSIDVDHIVPPISGGRDDPSNFALTHAHCNRSKQASDLRVARLLAQFERLVERCGSQPGRPNLSDVLQLRGGARFDLPIESRGGTVQFTLPDLARHEVLALPLYKDQLSGMHYCSTVLPIAYLHHDDRINPRAIAANSLRRLIEEFHAGLPQLHTALAWTELEDGRERASVQVFDGQHKAAAQVLLGVKEIPVRLFVNPDLDILLTANTHAGTTLRQVAFDKSVQRRLGSQLFQERIERYLSDLGRSPDDRGFSEQDLVNHFKGQWREVRRYILDDVRDAVTHHPDNRLKSYVDFGGRGSQLPLSYSSVEKTFYSFFIYQQALITPLDYRLEQGENPRELEKEQILRLMNVVADQIYIGRYEPAIGTYRLEQRVQAEEDVPPEHLRAFRMSKEEILYNWLRLTRKVVENYFAFQGRAIDEGKLFQYRLPEPLWDNLDRFIRNLAGLPLWVNRPLSETVFGGKQNYYFWQHIFETGRSPAGQQVLPEPIDLKRLIA